MLLHIVLHGAYTLWCLLLLLACFQCNDHATTHFTTATIKKHAQQLLLQICNCVQVLHLMHTGC